MKLTNVAASFIISTSWTPRAGLKTGARTWRQSRDGFTPHSLNLGGVNHDTPTPSRSYLNQHVRCKDVFGVFDCCSGLRILFIGELGRLPGPGLHHHIEALLDERLDAGRRKRHTAFTLEDFFGHTDGELFVRNTCRGEEERDV